MYSGHYISAGSTSSADSINHRSKFAEFLDVEHVDTKGLLYQVILYKELEHPRFWNPLWIPRDNSIQYTHKDIINGSTVS